MKKDKFAEINSAKRHGNTVVIAAAIVAICLAGILCAWKLQQESNNIFFESSTFHMNETEEKAG